MATRKKSGSLARKVATVREQSKKDKSTKSPSAKETAERLSKVHKSVRSGSSSSPKQRKPSRKGLPSAGPATPKGGRSPSPSVKSSGPLWTGTSYPNMKTIRDRFGSDVRVTKSGDGRWVVTRKK